MVDKITRIIQLYLNDYKRAYYLRELADKLKKPHQTIKPYLGQLVEKQILIKIERKNITEYKLNIKDPRVINYLVIAEKQRLIDRIEKDTLFHMLFEDFASELSNNTFIIFGSGVNEFKKGSDIDILIIGKKKIPKIIEKFELISNKELHIVQIPNLNALDPKDPFSIEVFSKHLILNNPEQIIRFFLKVSQIS